MFYLRNCSSRQPCYRDGNCRLQYRIDRLVSSSPVTKIPRRERHRQNRRVLRPSWPRLRILGGGIPRAGFRPTHNTKNNAHKTATCYGDTAGFSLVVRVAAETTVTGENTAGAPVVVVVVTYLRQCQSLLDRCRLHRVRFGRRLHGLHTHVVTYTHIGGTQW